MDSLAYILDTINTVGLDTTALRDLGGVSAMFDSPPTVRDVIEDALTSAFESEFFKGGALLAILAWVGMQFRSIPTSLWSRFKRSIRYTAYIDDTDTLYDAFSDWFQEKHPEKFRNIQVLLTKKNSEDRKESSKYELRFRQSEDYNWFWYKRNIIFISKERETLENASIKEDRFVNSYKFYSFFSKVAMLKLFNDVKEQVEEKAKSTDLCIHYNNNSKYWQEFTLPVVKDIENVYVDFKDDLIEDLRTFKSSVIRYKSLGINPKRGYLLHGAPGNGIFLS
jgi:chaperone BCS1